MGVRHGGSTSTAVRRSKSPLYRLVILECRNEGVQSAFKTVGARGGTLEFFGRRFGGRTRRVPPPFWSRETGPRKSFPVSNVSLSLLKVPAVDGPRAVCVSVSSRRGLNRDSVGRPDTRRDVVLRRLVSDIGESPPFRRGVPHLLHVRPVGFRLLSTAVPELRTEETTGSTDLADPAVTSAPFSPDSQTRTLVP